MTIRPSVRVSGYPSVYPSVALGVPRGWKPARYEVQGRIRTDKSLLKIVEKNPPIYRESFRGRLHPSLSVRVSVRL